MPDFNFYFPVSDFLLGNYFAPGTFLRNLPKCFSQQKGVEMNKLTNIKWLKESRLEEPVWAMECTWAQGFLTWGVCMPSREP